MKDSKQLLGESSVILVVTTILTKTISAIFKLPLASDAFLGEVGFGYFSVAHDLFMPFYLLAVAIGYLESGYYGLYKGQKIIYSKTQPEYINQRTKG